MLKFRSSALALLSLGVIAAAASGQQYPQRQQYRTNQVQRQPAATQYGQQPQYRQQTQQRTTDRTYSATADEYGRARVSNADHKIALLLANCNKAQIKLARYALDRAQSSDVREFADSLQQDHDITLRQLRRFAPEVANVDSSRGGYDQEQRRGGNSRMIRAWDDATVAQQISDRIVRKTRDELSEKEGEEFDHCFVGQQLVAHQQDIAKMEVYRQYASTELRQVIDEAIEIAEGHEQEARELAEDMRGGHRRDRREEYAESRDDSDWDDEGRIRRTSYEERSSESGDEEDRSYRKRNRDDSDDDDEEMEDDDHNRDSRDRDDEDEDDDDDDRRDDRTEQYFRDRDR